MEDIKSTADSETIYRVEDEKITVSRGGDSMQIAFENLEDTIKVFREDVQAEIRALRRNIPTKRCGHCNMLFAGARKRKYCNETCQKAAEHERDKKKRKPQTLAEVNAEARRLGMSYGQYQALRYKENMTW